VGGRRRRLGLRVGGVDGHRRSGDRPASAFRRAVAEVPALPVQLGAIRKVFYYVTNIMESVNFERLAKFNCFAMIYYLSIFLLIIM
jgi:hypothetical protein